MILSEDEDEIIFYYADVFDFYREYQELPLDYAGDKIIGRFIKQFVDNNIASDEQNDAMMNIIKEHVLGFIAVLLESTRESRKQYKLRAERIDCFRNASIEERRLLWPDEVTHIKEEYPTSHIDIDGYSKLFGQFDNEAVFKALISDWEKANEYKLEECILKQMNISMHYRCKRMNIDKIKLDYETSQLVQKKIYSNEKLRELLQLIGRAEESRCQKEKDCVEMNYQPHILSPSPTVTEKEKISIGNSLINMLPMETAIMSDPIVEMLFYHKFASYKLLQFANEPQTVGAQKQEKKPRLDKGPMILCIDTSSSMSGAPIALANAILQAALQIARHQKRKCFLITFSVRAHCFELTSPKSWARVDQWLEKCYSGFTNGEIMFEECIIALQKDDFKMADVLIISDFQFDEPSKKTQKDITHHQAQGTHFYGLGINSTKTYEKYLNKLWIIGDPVLKMVSNTN